MLFLLSLFCCRLIIIILNPNLSPSLSTLSYYNSPWLQAFEHSNSLCAWATRAITNHALIREYCLRFFPNKDFSCLYGDFPIESRRHVLFDCKRHNGYWNPKRDLLCHFILFLSANPKAFAFIDHSLSVSPNWFWKDVYNFLGVFFSFSCPWLNLFF